MSLLFAHWFWFMSILTNLGLQIVRFYIFVDNEIVDL